MLWIMLGHETKREISVKGMNEDLEETQGVRKWNSQWLVDLKWSNGKISPASTSDNLQSLYAVISFDKRISEMDGVVSTHLITTE